MKLKLREVMKHDDAWGAEISLWNECFCVPYLEDIQTIVIVDLLIRLKPRKCFEWGCGWSTVFFPKLIPESEWISMESRQMYFDLIAPHLPPNVKLMLRNYWETYVSEAAKEVKGQPFDFVFVDGERRDDCVEMALQILRKGGIAVMHDRPPIESLRNEFEENGVSNGLWWGRK